MNNRKNKSQKTLWVLVSVLIVLAGCTKVENAAASLIPTSHQNYDASDLKSGHYQLDPEHASLHISFNHMGFSTTVARFDAFDATLQFDAVSPHTVKLEAVIDMASINTGNPEFDDILKGKDYFDIARFPRASFTSDEVYFASETTAEVPGTLTLHGVSQPVILNVTFQGAGKNWISGAYTIGFEAKTIVQRSAFGLKKLLPLTGEDVKITIHAEFKREND